MYTWNYECHLWVSDSLRILHAQMPGRVGACVRAHSLPPPILNHSSFESLTCVENNTKGQQLLEQSKPQSASRPTYQTS